MLKCLQGSIALTVVAATALFVAGCGQEENKGARAKDKAASGKGKSGQLAEKKTDDHSDWWCAEHGMPEEVCAQCNAKVAAEFRKKGDWCNDHDRPKSQCFKCDPKLKEKFAAQYRAKYGKEPPPIEDDERKDDKPKEEKKG